MPDDSILKEIKDNWLYCRDYWREIYSEGEKDVRYEIDGPWDKDDMDARAGRVTLTLDELSQYTNQICNEFRMNKRGVKVNPRGDGADDETARYRAAMIREIEYQSRAQQAYVTAGENMVRRSYGFVKLLTDFEPGSFRRCLKLARVMNPGVIFLDPDAKEQDWSDGKFGFEVEGMRERIFKARFGKKASVTSFSDEHVQAAPGWISTSGSGYNVQVASYWKVDEEKKPLYLLENGQEIDPSEKPVEIVKIQPQDVQVADGRTFKSSKAAVIEGQPYRIIDEREDNDNTVTQYVTNGLEILETKPSDFKEIPLIPMFGREEWTTDGGSSKRRFLSAIRLARGAYKAYCYARSAMVERLAMDPKTPYEGWEGQFATQTDFSKVNQNPQGYVEFRIIESSNGQQILDKPTRNLTEPQIGQYETAAESFRRAIQAAMGGSPLPTSAQRQNQKSGVALDKIEQSSDQGNFHFIDNYNIALERVGRMMDQALDVVYDTPREVGLRSEDGEYSTGLINQTHPDTGEPVGFHTAKGDHGVTISTGPSSQSMRDEADKFLDNLSQNEAVFPRIADLVVKMKDLGPIGDKIAERLAPPGAAGVPPELQAQISQAQQTIAAMAEEIKSLKAGDEIKRYTVDEQEKTKRVLGLIKVDQQDAETRLDQMLGAISQRFQSLSDMHSQLLDQQHQREMATQQQEASAAAQQQNEPEPVGQQ